MAPEDTTQTLPMPNLAKKPNLLPFTIAMRGRDNTGTLQAPLHLSGAKHPPASVSHQNRL